MKFIGRLLEPLDCDILAMGGESDRAVTERLLMKWGELTTGAFDLHIVNKGGHFYWTQSEEDEMEFLTRIVDFVLIKGEATEGDDVAIDNQSTVSSVTFNDSIIDVRSVNGHVLPESKSGQRY